MRYGLIVAPTTLSDLRPAPGTLDTDLVRSRLPQDDLAIEVIDIDPTVDVAEQIDQFFDAHPDDVEGILFYASTYVALSPEGELFLCLDPMNPDVGDALRDIAGALSEKHTGPLLMVLDCRHAADEEDPFRSAVIAGAIRTAIDPAATGAELLVAAQPSPAVMEDAASPFTRAFLAELDEADPTRRLLAKELYQRIDASERLLGVVPCVAYTRGLEPFELLRGDGRASTASMVDEAEALDRHAETGSADEDGGPASEDNAAAEEAGGSPSGDSGPPSEDSGPPSEDSGPPSEDSGPPGEDGGPPGEDGGSEDDAGAESEGEAPADDDTSIDVEVDEPAVRHVAIPPPPAVPVLIAGARSKPSVPAALVGAADRAVAVATMVISDRPPASVAPASLPKIMISDRPPPPRAASETPKVATDAARVSEPAKSVESGAVTEAPKVEEPAATPEPTPEKEPSAAPEPPTYADHVAQGDRLAARDAEGALAEYKKALLLVTPAQKEERADVYVRIGQVKLLQDKRREAISNFEKATQLSPNHRPALEAIAKLSVEERDWRGVAATEEKLLATLTDPGERYGRLMEFGERWARVAYDAERARSAFLRAREIKPDDLDVLAKLAHIHEAAGAVEEAFALRVEIADKTADGPARAALYTALGTSCLAERKDEEAALAFFEQALDADPEKLEPLATAATLLADRQEWSELEATYRRMLPRTDRIPEADIRRRVRWELNRRLALLFRDHLEDPEAALKALEKAIADLPRDMTTRQTAAALARDLGKWDLARGHLQACAQLDPMVVQTYHDLFDVFQKLGRPDQAWGAASVTAQLGHADQRERFIYDEGKTDDPPKPTRALNINK